MALTIYKTVSLETNGEQVCIAQEPDGTIYQYYVESSTHVASDKSSARDETYSSFQWGGLAHHLTVRAVATTRVKHFPLIGAVGFYKNLYTNKSYVLTPIHIEQKTFKPPTLQATISNQQVHLIVTAPQDITYTVYRVIMRGTYFAAEYIIYNTDSYVDVPKVIGTYEVTAIGYNEDTGVVSSESNSVTITVQTGKASWEPDPISLPLSGLYDVSISSPQDLQMLQYNAAAAKWQNKKIPTVVTATLTAADWANNQQTITVTGVVADETKQFIQPTPTISTRAAYETANIRCVNQGANSLTFSCTTVPSADITIYVSITEVSV